MTRIEPKKITAIEIKDWFRIERKIEQSHSFQPTSFYKFVFKSSAKNIGIVSMPFS